MPLFYIKRRVFNETFLPFLKCNTPVQIFYGGAGSGKSRFLAQRVVLDVYRDGRQYLIVRNTAKSIRRSVFNEIQDQIRFFRLQPYFKVNETEMVITCKSNNCQIFFAGLDDVEKLKSIRPDKGVLTDIWFEEATESAQSDYDSLSFRLRGLSKNTKRITLSFNPIYRQHWIYKRFFAGQSPELGKNIDDGKVFILRTNYQHNRFLTEQDIERIEDFKLRNYEYYQVYGLGEWGSLGKTIFTNWRAADLSEIKNTLDNWRNGIDFGYGGDPAAFVRSARKGNTIYITDGLYQHELTNPQLARLVKPILGNESVACDCAEPKSIQELRTDAENPLRAYACKKGKDSLLHGLQWLKQFEIVIDSRLTGFISEAATYSWRRDKSGESIGTPEDRNNHLWDALRYAWEGDMVQVCPLLYTTKDFQEDEQYAKAA